MLEPETMGAIGIGCVVAGAGAAQVWHQLVSKPKKNSVHCPQHEDLVKAVIEVKNDVKWLRKKNEEDRTHVLLDGILTHLVKNNESQSK